MKLLSVLIILPVILFSRQSPVTTQKNWGEEVEGIQLRIGLSSDAALAGARLPSMPLLEVQLQNRSKNSIRYNGESITTLANIEIDGVWYSMAGGGSCCSALQQLKPGEESGISLIRHFQSGNPTFPLDSSNNPVNPRLDLKPGSHTFRVRSANSDRRILVDNPSPHGIVVISNVITVDVR